MAGRYIEYLPSGYRLNIDDKSWWVERDRDDFDTYNLFAMSDDGVRWDIYIDYKGVGLFSRRERVDHVNSYSDDLREVTDLLDIWEELVDDRAYMVQRGLAASVKESVVIPDEYRGGNCFEVALRNVMDDSNLFVCHGVVRGQGALEGIEFPHAWNEFSDGDYVLDESNGNVICMPRDAYYAMARLDPSTVRRYDSREAMEEAVRTGVYGPWEQDLMFDFREV